MLNNLKVITHNKRLSSLFICILGSFVAHPVYAHFQMLYTPQLQHAKSTSILFKMPFTHPANNGQVMATDTPEAFYFIKKGKKYDLLDSVKQINWQSAVNSDKAYQASAKLRGLGDYVFILQPAPYFEAEENTYIQQITKAVVNVGQLPSDWQQDFKLSAEIVPLVKPYSLYEGGLFSAVVKSQGKPVPFAAIEVELINYLPDMENNRFAKKPVMPASSDTFVAQTIYADANGTFHFPLLKAGHWGFAALGVGKLTTFNGKPLSQDAVIWVQAQNLPQ